LLANDRAHRRRERPGIAVGADNEEDGVGAHLRKLLERREHLRLRRIGRGDEGTRLQSALLHVVDDADDFPLRFSTEGEREPAADRIRTEVFIREVGGPEQGLTPG
jgi:hypothetical protein